MMDDLPKRKRPHTTAHSNRDLNGYKVDVKRQKNHYLSNIEMAGLFTSLRIEEQQRQIGPDGVGPDIENNPRMNETDQVQSKLGQLRLNHLTEPDVNYENLQAFKVTNIELRETEIQKRAKSTTEVEGDTNPSTGTGITCTQVNKDIAVLGDQGNEQYIQRSLQDSHIPRFEQVVCDTENNWHSSLTVEETVRASAASQLAPSHMDVTESQLPSTSSSASTQHEKRNQRTHIQFSRHCRRSASLPPYSMNNNLDPFAASTSTNNRLFSISPDMMSLPLSAGYTGLPLIPQFAQASPASARRNDPPAYSPNNMNNRLPGIEIPGDNNIAVEDRPPEWDDEGFDEPIERDSNEIQHSAMSDIEEDLVNVND